MKLGNYAALSIVIILWASSPAIAKILLNSMDKFQILFYITMFASLSLFSYSLASGKAKKIKKLSIHDIAIFFGMGMLGVFIYYVFMYSAMLLLPVQQVSILNYLWPVSAVIFSALLLGDKLTEKSISAIALSFVGAVFVITKGSPDFHIASLLGIAIALVPAVSYGLFSTISKKLGYDNLIMLAFGYGFSFLCSAAFVALTSTFIIPSFNNLLGLLWIGVAVNAFAYLLWLGVIEKGDMSKVANLIYLTPFLALAFISTLAGEAIEISSIIGIAIIVSGILIQLKK